MTRVIRRPASPQGPRHCLCKGRDRGFHPHPTVSDWWVCGECDKPAKMYLDAKEEQGHDWPG